MWTTGSYSQAVQEFTGFLHTLLNNPQVDKTFLEAVKIQENQFFHRVTTVPVLWTDPASCQPRMKGAGSMGTPF